MFDNQRDDHQRRIILYATELFATLSRLAQNDLKTKCYEKMLRL